MTTTSYLEAAVRLILCYLLEPPSFILLLYLTLHLALFTLPLPLPFRVWLSNKCGKRLPLSARRSYTAAFLLRQRMLAFVQNIEYYMMFEVIERHWLQFEQDMKTVSREVRVWEV